MSEQLNSSLVDVVSITLRVPGNQISDNFSPADCANWDSVRHLMLMLAIEDKFQISFSEKEIAELRRFATIRDAVRSHIALK
jgi:acyl carrier protein